MNKAPSRPYSISISKNFSDNTHDFYSFFFNLKDRVRLTVDIVLHEINCVYSKFVTIFILFNS